MKNTIRSIASAVAFVGLLVPVAVQAQPVPNKHVVTLKVVDAKQSIWGTLLGLFN